MPRLTKKEQLLKDLDDVLYEKGRFISKTLQPLMDRIENAIQDSKTELSHIIALYKIVEAAAEKLAVEKARQDKEIRDARTDKIKQDKLRTDKKIADEKLKVMVKERMAKETPEDIEKALADHTNFSGLDDEEDISSFFSIHPENSSVQ